MLTSIYLFPSKMWKIGGENGGNGDMGAAQQKSENGRHPGFEGHHGVRQEDDEHHLPRALGRHLVSRSTGIERQRQGAKRRQEEQHHVAHPKQISVLHEPGVQEAEQQHEKETVGRVIDVLGRQHLRMHQSERRHQAGEDDEEGDDARDARMLQLADVSGTVEGVSKRWECHGDTYLWYSCSSSSFSKRCGLSILARMRGDVIAFTL